MEQEHKSSEIEVIEGITDKTLQSICDKLQNHNLEAMLVQQGKDFNFSDILSTAHIELNPSIDIQKLLKQVLTLRKTQRKALCLTTFS